MGCGASTPEPAAKPAPKEDPESNVVKLVVMGTSGSGKSTLLKQMTILNKDGFYEEDRKVCKALVHENTCEGVVALVSGAEKLGLSVDSIKPKLQKLEEHDGFKNKQLTPEVGTLIKELWSDPQAAEAWSSKCQMEAEPIDSTKYFLDDIERIAEMEFIPSDEDLLRSKEPPTATVDTSEFVIKSMDFRMYVPASTLCESDKFADKELSDWLPGLNAGLLADAMIYVVSIADYDNKLRMQESLATWQLLINSKSFYSSAWVLFFNKSDLFNQKLPNNPINKYFPEYDGENAPEPVSNFIKAKFLEKNKRPTKSVFTHVTCATDTSNVNFNFSAVLAIILEGNLKESGLG